MALKTINVGQTTTGTLPDARDQHNNPITIDGTYTCTWHSSDPTKQSFGTPSANGNVLITGVTDTGGNAVQIGCTISGGTIPNGQTVEALTEGLIVNDPPRLASVSVVMT